MTVKIHLLGPFQILSEEHTIPGVYSPYMQSFIAYLAVNDRYPIPRETIAAALWPDSGQEQAFASLRKLIFKFKHELPQGARFLETDHRSCHLAIDADLDVDLHDFMVCFEQANEAHSRGQAEEEYTALKQAASLYQGDLAQECDGEWIHIEREGIRARYLDVLARITDLLIAAGRFEESVQYARTWISADPLNEHACLKLMQIFSAMKDRAAAILTYHQCTTVLERDLGIEPSTELKQAYEALIKRQVEAPPVQIERQPLANLIGREREWQLLIRTWAECLDGHNRIVILSGEAGIGKTRLVSDFTDWLRRNGALIHREECFPLQSDLAYAPLISWIRNISPELLDESQREELSALLPGFTPVNRIDRGRQPLIGQWQRTHLFETISRAFVLGGGSQVFILDNIQWCDKESRDWLEYFIHFSKGQGFLFLITLRPEELGQQPAIKTLIDQLNGKPDVLELELSRLDLRQTGDLAGSIWQHKPSLDQVRWLFAESEGVPLFIIELVRANHSKGNDFSWGSGHTIPARISSVIEQRLYHLSIPAREAAEIGAVMGGPFAFSALRDLGLIQEETLIHALDELWRRRIIREEGDLYTFTHEKIREVLYAQIGLVRRKWLHLNLAQWLEKSAASGSEINPALIAFHYRFSEYPQRAIEYYRSEVRRARSIYAVDHATRCLLSAIELNTIPSVQAELFEELGDLYGLGLHTAEALSSYEKAIDFLPVGDRIRHAAVLRKQAALICRLETAKAENLYLRAENLLSQVEDRGEEFWQEWIQLKLSRMEACYWQNRAQGLSAELDALHDAVTAYGTAPQKASYNHGVVQRNNLLDRFVPRPETIAIARERLEIVSEMRDMNQIAEAEFSLGFVLGLAGLFTESCSYLSNSAASARRTGNNSLLLRNLTYLSINHRRQRWIHQTALNLDELASTLRHCDMPPYAGVLHANRAWIEYRQGNLHKAELYANKALGIWQKLENTYPIQWPALSVLLAVQIQKGETAKARKTAADLLDSRQMMLDDLVARRLLAMQTCRPDGWTDVVPMLEDAAYL